MRVDFVTDINRDHAAALNYTRIDQRMVKILWWHFGVVFLLACTNSILKIANYLPSPFSWRVINPTEACWALLIGLCTAAIPQMLQGKMQNHYLWRILVSTALTTFSYLLVFISGASIEMHFHFFMIMTLLVVYADWRLGWIVFLLTALHHIILNAFQPQWVFYYGANLVSLIAHAVPVYITAIFTTMLCENNRNALIRLHQSSIELQASHTQLSAYNQTLEHRVTARTADLARATSEAEAARMAAERASHAKSRFLGTMSHELRTPLNAILGYTDLIQEELSEDGPLPPTLEEDLHKIRTSGGHLLKMINDLLDLTNIDTGQMSLTLTTFEVQPLLDEVRANLQPLISKNGNTFTMDVAPSLPPLHTDRTKLGHILTNLFHNATKFTHAGTIHVNVQLVPATEGETNQLQIQITDSGIGMTQDQIENLFQLFTQADNSSTRKYGGAGLGLALSQRLAHLLKGHITALSTQDQGSSFTLQVPIHFSTMPQAAPLAPPATSIQTKSLQPAANHGS